MVSKHATLETMMNDSCHVTSSKGLTAALLRARVILVYCSSASLRKSATKRRLRRGVTLIEVLIVVAIMAVIAGGATLLVFPQFAKARVQSAQIGADVVKTAAELYLNTDGDASTCPTVKDLAEAKKLDPKKTDDPWGRPYRISCEDDIVVYSNGKDGKENSADDVRNDFKPADIKRVAEL